MLEYKVEINEGAVTIIGLVVKKEDPIEQQWNELGDIKWITDEKGYKKLTYSNDSSWGSF